jgi:hypothetical protein
MQLLLTSSPSQQNLCNVLLVTLVLANVLDYLVLTNNKGVGLGRAYHLGYTRRSGQITLYTSRHAYRPAPMR